MTPLRVDRYAGRDFEGADGRVNPRRHTAAELMAMSEEDFAAQGLGVHLAEESDVSQITLPERYAQRSKGRKMHLVTDYGADRVAPVARCGARPDVWLGDWRMTSNLPLAHACRNCRRARPRNVVEVPE